MEWWLPSGNGFQDRNGDLLINRHQGLFKQDKLSSGDLLYSILTIVNTLYYTPENLLKR